MGFKRRIGKIKVDFLNMRIEFSPNIEILSKKTQNISGGSDIEEVILSIEMMENLSENTKPAYKTYVLESNNLEDDEPFDLKNPWYKLEGLELEIVKQDGIPDTSEASSVSSTPTTPAQTPTQTPQDSEQIQKMETQLASLQNMIQNIDQNFQDGKISQDEYIKKKNFLGEKMGALMGQISQLKG